MSSGYSLLIEGGVEGLFGLPLPWKCGLEEDLAVVDSLDLSSCPHPPTLTDFLIFFHLVFNISFV